MELLSLGREAYTTIQMILGDSAQTLMEVGTNFNHLLKCWAINGGGHFYLPRWSHLPAS